MNFINVLNNYFNNSGYRLVQANESYPDSFFHCFKNNSIIKASIINFYKFIKL